MFEAQSARSACDVCSKSSGKRKIGGGWGGGGSTRVSNYSSRSCVLTRNEIIIENQRAMGMCVVTMAIGLSARKGEGSIARRSNEENANVALIIVVRVHVPEDEYITRSYTSLALGKLKLLNDHLSLFSFFFFFLLLRKLGLFVRFVQL